MQTIPYPQVKETLYSEQLPNGLTVFILPKEGFQKNIRHVLNQIRLDR